MKTINELLTAHPFFKDFAPSEIDFISGCGKNRLFKANEVIARQNSPADHFYLIKEGKIAITLPMPSRKSPILQTMSDGEILGWSWLFPPYQWMFDCVSLEVTRVIELNGLCLRQKLDQDPALGYKLMKRFAALLTARLNATRLQLLDAYQHAEGT